VNQAAAAWEPWLSDVCAAVSGTRTSPTRVDFALGGVRGAVVCVTGNARGSSQHHLHTVRCWIELSGRPGAAASLGATSAPVVFSLATGRDARLLERGWVRRRRAADPALDRQLLVECDPRDDTQVSGFVADHARCQALGRALAAARDLIGPEVRIEVRRAEQPRKRSPGEALAPHRLELSVPVVAWESGSVVPSLQRLAPARVRALFVTLHALASQLAPRSEAPARASVWLMGLASAPIALVLSAPLALAFSGSPLLPPGAWVAPRLGWLTLGLLVPYAAQFVWASRRSGGLVGHALVGLLCSFVSVAGLYPLVMWTNQALDPNPAQRLEVRELSRDRLRGKQGPTGECKVVLESPDDWDDLPITGEVEIRWPCKSLPATVKRIEAGAGLFGVPHVREAK
jgi:hypothetical protein